MAFAQACIVYYTAATLLHLVVPAVAPVASVQSGKTKPGQELREARSSIGPLAVKAAVWTLVERMHASGHGLLYSDPVFSSWSNAAYALFTIIALDYLHDTWFYWTHRFLHWAPVYRNIHLMHHKSTVPTAYCGYSFHVVEAVIVFANEVIVCYLLPVHMGLHRVYHMYTTMIHVGGHAGYEMAPFIPSLEGFLALLIGGWQFPASCLNTVRHHDMHHRFPNVHFSLYMTHWDRLMGTEHKGYSDAVEQHFSGKVKGKGVAAPVVAPAG